MKNEQEKINKNSAIKAYLVGAIPFLFLVWLIGNLFESSFMETFIVIVVAYFAWTVFKSIITSITFHLFLKKDLVQNYFNIFNTNSFPEPDNSDIENLELYLESVAMDPDNHPTNIVATAILNEFGNARTSGSMLVLFRLNGATKEALKRYQHQFR